MLGAVSSPRWRRFDDQDPLKAALFGGASYGIPMAREQCAEHADVRDPKGSWFLEATGPKRARWPLGAAVVCSQMLGRRDHRLIRAW
jgi:hypothetical protein